jgi:serine/threonine protein kinase
MIKKYNSLGYVPINAERLIRGYEVKPGSSVPVTTELSPVLINSPYYLYEDLGSGGFGSAHRAVRVSDLVYLKEYNIGKKREETQSLEYELIILQKIKDSGCIPELPCLIGYFEDTRINGNFVNIVTNIQQDYNDVMPLKEFITRRIGTGAVDILNYSEAVKIISHCVKGVYYLSQLGVAHMNINLSNITVDLKTNDIQFINFARLCKYQCDYFFLSPEIIEVINRGINVESDLTLTLEEAWRAQIFSLGMVLYVLLHFNHPINQYKDLLLKPGETRVKDPVLLERFYQSIQKIDSIYISPQPDRDIDIESKINDLIEMMLKISPSERPSPDVLKKHVLELQQLLINQTAMILSPATEQPISPLLIDIAAPVSPESTGSEELEEVELVPQQPKVLRRRFLPFGYETPESPEPEESEPEESEPEESEPEESEPEESDIDDFYLESDLRSSNSSRSG